MHQIVGEPPDGTARTASRWRSSSPWYLAYLGMLVFQPVFDPTTGWFEWAAAGALVAVFVPLYLAAGRWEGRARHWAAVASTALGVLAMPVNSGASVLFVYAAAFAGSYLPRPAATRWLVGLTALTGVLATLSPVPLPYRVAAFAPPLIFIWVVGMASLGEAEREREAARLRVENARIEHLATLSERERLSRDLHDLLGQSLTGVVVRAQLAQRLVGTAPARAAEEMAEVERAARTALAQVRATVAGWRHVLIDDELAAAADTLTAAGTVLRVDRDPQLRLSPSAETVLALALREAVTNVVRHAAAGRCAVSVRCADGQVVLEVADDGAGGGGPDGGGLTGMRERVAALGGTVVRAPGAGVVGSGGGTAVTVTVPAEVAVPAGTSPREAARRAEPTGAAV